MSTNRNWKALVSLKRKCDVAWRPPDPEDDAEYIGEFERRGVVIPAGIRTALGLCVGAGEMWRQPPSAFKKVSSSEFFDYAIVTFLDWSEIVSEYQARCEMAEYVAAPPIVVGPVQPKYQDRSWIPFAADIGAGRFAIDLNPAQGGEIGQVIWMSDEAGIVRVVARSMSDFFSYGLHCLQFEAGAVSIAPVPPYIEAGATISAASDKECSRINSIWDDIIKMNTIRQKWIVAPHSNPEFHGGASEKQLKRIEERLGAVLPVDLRCSLGKVTNANCCWRLPGRGDHQQVYLHDVQGLVEQKVRLAKEVREGFVECEELDLSGLGSRVHLIYVGNEGWTDGESYYQFCSSQAHPLYGAVFVLRAIGGGPRQRLSLHSTSFTAFLEFGRQLVRSEIENHGGS